MWKAIKNYLHRFTPWVALTWRERSVRKLNEVDIGRPVSQDNAAGLRDDLVNLLEELLEGLKRDVRQTNEGLPVSPWGATIAQEILYRNWGFSLGRYRSNIPNAGRGVYVVKGCIKAGQITSMYPGTVYYPGEPLFFQSINNPFILRCSDGVMVDGRDRGISRIIYKSCLRRDQYGPHLLGDLSWMGEHPVFPLAIGQYVNNCNEEYSANVEYQEFDLPFDNIPLKCFSFLPHAFFSPMTGGGARDVIRCVPLVATRDIDCGEELFSNYFTEIVG